MLSSDEDDIDEMNSEYLENLARQVTKNSAKDDVQINAEIVEGYEDSDEVS